MASFSTPSCPDPQEVADAVAELAPMPPGARPLLVPIGASASLESLNQIIAQVQTDILERRPAAALSLPVPTPDCAPSRTIRASSREQAELRRPGLLLAYPIGQLHPHPHASPC